ncbi:MAG: RimK/LysX family protein [Chromatiaceae bacterium]
MSSNHAPQEPTRAGWREWLALPALGIPAIKAKLDTGARTSALHAFFTEPFRENGISMIRFGVRPLQRRQGLTVICTAAVLDQRLVSDSGGHRETRWVIATPARLGEDEWTLELTLTDRDSMLFRMLLGRSAMSGRLLVDPQASYLVGHKPILKRLYPPLAIGKPTQR